MSASQDRGQKITFVYSNLYQLYQKGKSEVAEQAQGVAPGLAPGLTTDFNPEQVQAHQTSAVIKAGDRNVEKAQVANFQPMTLLTRKPEAFGVQLARTAEAERKEVLQQPAHQNNALEGLKQNLETLNELHERLRFMLKELEDLVKE